MPRVRTKSDEKLPKYVYADQSRWVYKPYIDGKRGKPIRLCSLDSSIDQIWAAYNALVNAQYRTIDWLMGEYLSSPKFAGRSVRTQKDYSYYRKQISSFTAKSGQSFGEFPLRAVNTKTFQRYLDLNAHRPIAANREVEFLSTCYTWGNQRLDEITGNPVIGVDYHTETPRDRYVTDEEYNLVYNLAINGDDHPSLNARMRWIGFIMELCYLTRCRPGEARQFRKSDVLEEGLFLNRGKGSENEITGWSDRLETVVVSCLEWNEGAESHWLLHDRHGMPYKKNAFDSNRQRLMARAKKNGLQTPFTFHDLKAKGVSDHTDKASGHKTAKMKKVYDRVPGLVVSTR